MPDFIERDGPECQSSATPLLDIVMSLSDAMDLVNPQVVNHHHRTAYIAYCLAQQMGLSRDQQADLLWAGLLHDSGAFSLKDRLHLLEFEAADSCRHEEFGYRLLKGFLPFSRPAELIRFHHTWWEHGRGEASLGSPVPRGSHLLHLADRTAVISGPQEGVLLRVKEIAERIKEQSGSMFVPEQVDALETLGTKPSFWFDVTSPSIRQVLSRLAREMACPLNLQSLKDLARVLCRLIDFRSRFTSTHSGGVAVVASFLGRCSGLGEETCTMLEVAGFVHDLGKLAVPLELLEKPGKFTEDDFSVMKAHPYHTFRVLSNIKQLDTINLWAACHHERLDGRGYPFRLSAKELGLEARIMGLADVFTALAEDRPYRKGMSSLQIVAVLHNMATHKHLDGDLIAVLLDNFDETDALRSAAQAAAAVEYRYLWSPHTIRAAIG